MSRRPADAITPGPGQESVWDYPRPPRLEAEPREIRIVLDGVTIAQTQAASRVLETSHPPTYYLPPDAFAPGVLIPCVGRSWCEWKGRATYFDIVAGEARARKAAWAYPEPTPAFASIAGFVAVYAEVVDECWVGDHRVHPQEGNFYGGWITELVVGPFKGGLGTLGW